MRWTQVVGTCLCWLIAAVADAQTDRIAALIAEGDRLSAESVRQTATALLKYQEADRLAAVTPDIRLRATAKLNVVRGLYNNDAQTECLATGTEVESLARSINALDILGNLYRVTGACMLALGRFDEADATFASAAQILQTHGTSTQYALALNNRAANARLQGRLGHSIGIGQQAIAVVDRALAAGEELTPRVHFAVPFNLGKAIADSGDYVGARPYLERAFSAAERFNDIGGQMHALFDTGEWYESQGDVEKAARYYRRSLDFTRTQQNGHEFEGRSLEALGRLALGRGEFGAATQYLSDALQVYGTRELHLHLSTTLVLLARARGESGNAAGAERDLAQAIAISRRQKQSIGTVLALIERGRQRASARAIGGARADLDEAIAEANRERLLPLIPAAVAHRAAVEESAGNLHEALALYEQAADALDRIRGHIVSFDLRITFASATHQVFSGLVRVLENLHRERPADGFERRALMALERERSQSLALNAGLARGLSEPTADGPEVQIAQIQSALFAPDLADDRRRQLLTELDDAESALMMSGAATRPANTARRDVSLETLQSSLAPGEVLLEYSGGESRATVYVLTRSSFRVEHLSIGRGLADRVAFFVRALENDARDASISSGQVLSRELIEPLQLAPGSRLLIVATGTLARLPFGALPIVNRNRVEPLMFHHDISYLPSLTLFERRRSAQLGALGRRILAIADAQPPSGDTRRLPALPGSRIEAAAIARHASSTVLIGRDATEKAVKSQANAGYPIWHLATHAILDETVPERSAVVLGESDQEDGLLQAREIYQLPLQGTLVVLTGCRTADGQVSGAEGLHSLARAFLHAGGRTVAGALWELPDSGTADLVLSFYRELERGQDVASAMSRAQRTFAGRDPYASSRTWAPIVLMGDPAVTLAAQPRSSAVNAAAGAIFGMFGLVGIAVVKRRRMLVAGSQ
jgi:CHAT domain-containing protein/tetratricopeptide (TPR) repeat protein